MSEDLNVLKSGNSIKIVRSSDYKKPKIIEDDQLIIKVYKRRWLILSLYMFFTAIVACQWTQYSIITNIIKRYYNVSSFAVDCTSMIFMLCYGIFIFPVTYLIDRIGIRWILIIGSGLFFLGAWIKIFSVSPERFSLVLLGQTLIAIAMVTMMPLPGRVAVKWFGSKQLSLATACGVLGSQMGFSFSFLMTPILVKNHQNTENIGTELSFLLWCYAIGGTVNLALMIFLFQEEPKLPPSKTRALQKSNQLEKDKEFSKTLKRLFTNRSFLILCNSYGFSIGILNALCTLLNQLYLIHFENGEEDAGRIGLLIVLTGMFGIVAIGIILDKTQKFKKSAVIVYFLSLCGQIFFGVAVLMEIKWMVYASSIFLGFFITAYLALGYEMSSEYTYPESEVHSAGILNITNNFYGIALVLLLEEVLEKYGDVPVHVIFCLVLLLGLIMTIMTKDEHRRQDARNAATLYHDVPSDNIEDKIESLKV